VHAAACRSAGIVVAESHYHSCKDMEPPAYLHFSDLGNAHIQLPAIRFVWHSEYFLDEDNLGTDNLNAIGLGLPRIPGLAEWFIKFDADMVLVSELKCLSASVRLFVCAPWNAYMRVGRLGLKQKAYKIIQVFVVFVRGCARMDVYTWVHLRSCNLQGTGERTPMHRRLHVTGMIVQCLYACESVTSPG